MLRNYFTIAIRNIRRNLSYSLLNIFGLTLSIAACLIIFLLTKNELTYDSNHQKADRTYRVTLHALDYNSSVSMAIVPAMRTSFPELQDISQYWYRNSGTVKVGNTRYIQKDYAYADMYFTDIFDFHWLAGNPATALIEPNTVVLTQSTAQRYFGDKDPIGQIIQLDNTYDLKVSGIIKDIPGNTHLLFNFLVSFSTIAPKLKNPMSNFYAIMGGSAYIVTPPGYDIRKLEHRMPAFIKEHWGPEIAAEASLVLQPIQDIHFDQRYIQSTVPTTSRNTYRALIAIAIFIIITACINFINLATAQAMKRAKETGVRKALGAHRWQLIRQFLGETAIIVVSTVILGLMVAYLVLPQVAFWLSVKITVAQLNQPAIYGLLTALATVIILLAGLYPAFVQSSFKPALSLKSNTGMRTRGLTLRKSLVFVQFAASQILIIGTLAVAKQMDFFKNQDLGFNKEAVISFPLPDGPKRDVIAQQLKDNTGVKEVSFSSGAPSYNSSFAPFTCPELGLTKDDVTELKFIDEQYLPMFGIKVLAGTGISKRQESDTLNNVVVNETLLHKLGITHPEDAIGRRFKIGGDDATIQGVVQDFQSESKHKEKRPCILLYLSRGFNSASVRLQAQNMTATIEKINKEWSALLPDEVFTYQFLDDHIASLYTQEQKLYTAYRMFSILAIMIGCLGLYGLIAFTAVQRNKEVGIRKVLGASVADIIVLFGKEFMFLIAIAFFIAGPVAYVLMQGWLTNFAYHIHMNASIFLPAIGASVIIAAVTIAHQAIKAALANPLKSLKTE